MFSGWISVILWRYCRTRPNCCLGRRVFRTQPLLAKIVNRQLSVINYFRIKLVLDVWLGSEYTYVWICLEKMCWVVRQVEFLEFIIKIARVIVREFIIYGNVVAKSLTLFVWILSRRFVESWEKFYEF